MGAGHSALSKQRRWIQRQVSGAARSTAGLGALTSSQGWPGFHTPFLTVEETALFGALAAFITFAYG